MAVLFWNSTKASLAFAVHVLSAVSAYWVVQRKYPPQGRHRR